jgi:hypothetical protein
LPAAADIADAVWDEALAGHAGEGTAGAALSAASAPSAADVADAVWDEALAGHAGVGSAGEALTAAGSGADAATIADAVWDEAVGAHTGALATIATNVDQAISTTEANIRGDTSTIKTINDALTAGVTLGDDAITAAKIADDTLETGMFDTAYWNKVADHVIRRSFEGACDSSDGDAKSFRSPLGAVAKLTNKIAVVAGTLTVYEDDDTTPLGTQTLTADAEATPITAMDTD